MSEALDLQPSSMAVGGAAVARGSDGKVVFVDGALPGERVTAEVLEVKKSFSRAEVVQVLEPSPHRVEPPCPHVADGCGGCRWQFIEPQHQPVLKRELVVDSLSRIGGIDGAADLVAIGPELPDTGYRTTLRAAVIGGRAGLRKHHSHDVLGLDACLVAHPLIDELITDGIFGDAAEVTLRAGVATGERLVLASPHAGGIRLPDDVLVIGENDLRNGKRAWYHEEVAGRRWRISASSFFQGRPDGAQVLVDLAIAAVAELAPDATTLVDLCCGVGLFAGAVGGARNLEITGVERHGAAVHDARHNLADLGATVVRTSFESWRPAPADVVIADPARSGLGKQAVGAVLATKADLVVLVSCDPAALGRDAGLLDAGGYDLVRSTVVDLFPHTPHVEVVSAFLRR